MKKKGLGDGVGAINSQEGQGGGQWRLREEVRDEVKVCHVRMKGIRRGR